MMRRASRMALVVVAGFVPVLTPGYAVAGPTDAVETPAPNGPRVQRLVTPALGLQASFAPTAISAPGPLAYTLVATNHGAEALTEVAVVDEVVGTAALSCVPSMPATLAAGESLTCSTTREVTQVDIDYGIVIHVASASAELPGGDPLDDTDDVTAVADAMVAIAHRPRMSVSTATVTGRFKKGARVPIRLTVRNSGNVTLTRLAFGSNLRSTTCGTANLRTLAPGAVLACRATYKVTAADARKGRAAIAVVARAERPFGRTDTASDDVVAKTTVRATVVKKKR